MDWQRPTVFGVAGVLQCCAAGVRGASHTRKPFAAMERIGRIVPRVENTSRRQASTSHVLQVLEAVDVVRTNEQPPPLAGSRLDDGHSEGTLERFTVFAKRITNAIGSVAFANQRRHNK